MKILIIEPCNFVDYPLGGQLSFVVNMLKSYSHEEVILAGYTTDKKDETGVWTKKYIDGKEYNFYASSYVKRITSRPLIPERVKSFVRFKWNIRKILKADFDRIFIQAPEILFALPRRVLSITALDSPGVGNPLQISRYPFFRSFAKLYEKFYYKKLAKVKTIWASASMKEIEGFAERSKGLISKDKIQILPTRYDDSIFKVLNYHECRKELKIKDESIVFVTVGRLNWHKGWQMMIDAFKEASIFGSILYFIGEGEDKEKISSYIVESGLTESVVLLGRQDPTIISNYLNASDVFIMGSFAEGWSTTLVEACACGVPCVVTDFSSAEDMVYEGENGFVVKNRSVSEFAEKMKEALLLDRESVRNYDTRFQRLSVSMLRSEMLKTLNYEA